jgi:lysophospholipase L1-like esterase
MRFLSGSAGARCWRAVVCTAVLHAAPACAAERIVFVGDSITDGHTYPLLIRQALAEAGKPESVCINAGVAGDTAKGVRSRLDRDVFAHRPTRVTLSIGVNDALRGVALADYQADVAAVAERLKGKNVPLVILTTTILGPKHAEAEKRLGEYNAFLRKLAGQHGFAVAEVYEAMARARASEPKMLEPDQVHLTFDGYLIMARAVLDAFGHKDVPLPKALRLEPLPGLVRTWKVRPAGAKEPPLDEKAVTALQPDAGWKELTLPESDRQEHWWFDHERQRGFALALDKLAGKAPRYVAVAQVDAAEARQVFFNTGAQLLTIWLNGKRIYQADGWTGWHAGKERIAAPLRKGPNVIIIETTGPFFLSMTDDNQW